MPACASCGTDNAAGRKFCGNCGASLARACPSCGTANEPGMRFCGECGTALDAAAPPVAASAPVAERRLVSILFADLVGFTTLSESRDPEEVRELLSRYFETCRRLIGIYGGTVEKFIGDAVMAVWGTPTAQEDDAERAVRTALDLVAATAELGVEIGAPELQMRAGVLTGEAAVTLGAAAEGMVAGDLVNTASRVQAAAEPGTVLVGESTRRASSAAIAYEPAGAHELKGKAEPMELFRAVRVTSVRGGAVRAGELEPPFVGRDRELNLVKDLFHATGSERKAQLVSAIGIGGIGKSRLAWEFEKYIDGVAELVWWHRGRCLAYGDGVAYWALAEMVRMRALIAEEDSSADARKKLHSTLEDWVPDASERSWIEPRLLQLLGLGEEGGDDRETLFAAWRLFFERVSGRGPVVLVFEDLQWADAGLLDFVEHLLDWSRMHPIFVLALARPELQERRPGFGAGGRNATTLSLEPLTGEAMEQLLDGFVPGLPHELRAQILARAEGVPLYAVETVRMLLDRSLLERDGDVYRPTGPIDALEVPETLHALIAARLDGLSPDERRVLQDASVLGKSFTKSGLTAVSGLDEEALEPILRSLIRKEVLSVQADPRSPERGQYAFLQDLLKRIAYETLSRGDRKAKHIAAAAYLERAMSSELEFVEVIAAHYLDAYEAVPDAEDAPSLRAKAADRLTRAGERAASVAAHEEAQRYYEKAAGLVDDHVAQAKLLETAGDSATFGYRFEQALALLDRTVDLYNENGVTHAAARASATIGYVLWRNGDLDGAADRLAQALAVLADDEPDADIARLIETLGRLRYFQGDAVSAMERVDRALEIAEALFAVPVLVDALNTKSLLMSARARHQEALALLERAIALGREHGALSQLARALNNYGVSLQVRGEFKAVYANDLEGLEIARRIGTKDGEQQFVGGLSWSTFMLGDWEASARWRDQLDAPGAYPVMFLAAANTTLALPKGDIQTARAALDGIASYRDSTDAQLRSSYLQLESQILFGEGRYAEAADTAHESHVAAQDVHPGLNAHVWFDRLIALAALGDAGRLEEALREGATLPAAQRTLFLTTIEQRFTAALHGLHGEIDEADAAFARAEDGYRTLGLPFLLACTQAEHGEVLSGAGRADDASSVVDEARATFERLGATAWLARVDRVGAAVPA